MPLPKTPTNPDDLAEYLRVERAAIRRTGQRIPVSRFVRRLVYRRDGWKCGHCGNSPYAAANTRRIDEGLHLDHIRPWSSFEPGDPACDRTDNLRTLCGPCNRERSNYVSVHNPEPPATPIVRMCTPCLVAVEPRYERFLALPDRFDVYCAKVHHIGYAIPGWSIL